jgi:hypothetical protein
MLYYCLEVRERSGSRSLLVQLQRIEGPVRFMVRAPRPSIERSPWHVGVVGRIRYGLRRTIAHFLAACTKNSCGYNNCKAN